MICSTFVDHLYIENEENNDFAMEKHEFRMKNEWFLNFFFDHLHIENGQKYIVCIKNMMLIFDEKMMIFDVFLGPKYSDKTYFLHVFVVFFDLKIASDDFTVLNKIEPRGWIGFARGSGLQWSYEFFTWLHLRECNQVKKSDCIWVARKSVCNKNHVQTSC